MRVVYLLLLCVIPYLAVGQQVVAKEVNSLNQNGAVFQKSNVLEFITNDLSNRSAELEGLSSGTLFALNKKKIQELAQGNERLIEFQIPTSNRSNLTLQLIKHDVLTPDFKLFTSDDRINPVPYTRGKHYKGIIKGDDRSLVVISFFNDEVMGLVSNDEGNYVLGRLQDSREGEHVLYRDDNLTLPFDLDCGTEDDGVVYTDEQLNYKVTGRDVGDCIKLYIEIDNDIVVQKGGEVPATNYIEGLFAQSIILYANDDMAMSVNEVLAWTSTSPYSSTSSSGMLSDFQANTGSLPNGANLGHLVSYQASGGIAAGFSGICNSNPDLSKCFSSIDASYANVPTYSWSVMVITHEMGHLIGSRHTHACVWNGNGTAIDGCSGQTEGTCPLPGNPSGGGTIMSYCHLQSVGINLNLGFGPQPKAVVNATVNASGNCLTTCGGPPPPPSYCASNGSNVSYEYIQSVSVSDLTNVSGSNGGYVDFTGMTANFTAGSSYTVTCVPGFTGGSYTEHWAVWIDYNDDKDWSDAGELVGSGSGTGTVNIGFTVPSNVTGNTRMRVSMQYNAPPPNCGSFTYGEVEDYTASFGGAPVPTCTDGIMNGDETGVDCGGQVCPACPTCDDNIMNGEETGVDCGGPDCPACPTCDDNIMNGGETGVDCGGPDCPACPTCFDGVQNGQETGVDCGGPDCVACPPGPTCTDGIQNGEETGVDCGGPDCDPCGGSTEVFGHYFESGWNGWQDGGSDCYRYNNSNVAWEGNYSIRLRDNSGTSSAMTSSYYDLSSYGTVELKFYFYPSSMEPGEDFWVRYNDGSGWETIATYAAGTSFNNYSFYVATITMTSAQFNLTNNARFRFQCDASSNGDRIYMDAITLNASDLLLLTNPDPTISKLDVGLTPFAPELNEEKEDDDDDEITIYPNPTHDVLNIDFEGEVTSLRVVSMDGARSLEVDTTEDFRQIQTDKLAPGMYFLLIEREGKWTPVKFMKL